MPEPLLLPAPKDIPKSMSFRQRWMVGIFLMVSFFGIAIPSWTIAREHSASQKAVEQVKIEERQVEDSLQSAIKLHQSTLVRVMVNHRDTDLFRLSDLFTNGQIKSPRELLDTQKWQGLVKKIKSSVEQAPIRPGLVWDKGEGWHLQLTQQEIRVDPSSVDLAQASLLDFLLTLKDNIVLNINTRTIALPISEEEIQQLTKKKQAVDELVSRPITLHIGDTVRTLDLNSEENYVIFHGAAVEANPERIKQWLDEVAQEYYKASPTLTITGKEEIRRGVFRAIVSGEFKEGQQILVDQVYEQIIKSLGESTRDIDVKLHEIPVKIYSELEQKKYDLLAVGYSEYSTGNDGNRVHNLTTGLKRINGLLIDPGQEISFNKIHGEINGEFRMGWGIFGTVALPVLGGGLCQVSTTFYRALLNLGVPITQRQPHSWDLSYYQKGGYGLDATVFPEKGVDVKAVNDFDSQLFIYSYTRPETEEAYVLIYGDGDGRKASLTPEKEYIPTLGPKTLRWKQTIEFPNGEKKENEIVSRYKA